MSLILSLLYVKIHKIDADQPVHLCNLTSVFVVLCLDSMSLFFRKPVFGVSDLVPHKLGCAVTEDG